MLACNKHYRPWTDSSKSSLKHFQFCRVGLYLGIMFFSILFNKIVQMKHSLLKFQVRSEKYNASGVLPITILIERRFRFMSRAISLKSDLISLIMFIISKLFDIIFKLCINECIIYHFYFQILIFYCI
jgi:hypothetical protein